MEEWLRAYGYIAVFLFSCIEGEFAVITAGYLCTKGILQIEKVMLFAFLGTVITEQIVFFVGRIWGRRIIARFPKLQAPSERAFEFLKKYGTVYIFSFRFIYGVRNVSPLVIGASGISPVRYSSLNVPASIIWAFIVAGSGYVFSDAIQKIVDNFHYFSIFVLIIFAIFVIYLVMKRNRKN